MRSVVLEMAIAVDPDTIDKNNLNKRHPRAKQTTKLTRPVQKICVLPIQANPNRESNEIISSADLEETSASNTN